MFIRQWLRTAAKAGAFAAVCVPVAAGAHVLAGGALDPQPATLAGMPIAAFAYVFARCGPRRAGWLFSVFTVAQVLLHTAFAPTGGGHGAHGGGPAMVGLHLAATVVAVLWVVRVEPALTRLRERLATAARRLIVLLEHLVGASQRRRGAMPCRPVRARRPRVVGAVGLRGPPGACRVPSFVVPAAPTVPRTFPESSSPCLEPSSGAPSRAPPSSAPRPSPLSP